MNHYLTFIVESKDENEIVSSLSKALSLNFTARDSLYWGEYSLARSSTIEELRVYPNLVDED